MGLYEALTANIFCEAPPFESSKANAV